MKLKSMITKGTTDISFDFPPTFPARPSTGGEPFGRVWNATSKRDIIYTPKYNGWRVFLNTVSGVMLNRQLERLSIESEFERAINIIRRCIAPVEGSMSEWLDCEGLSRRHGIGKGTLIVLDMPSMPGRYEDRQSVLRVCLPSTHIVDQKPLDDYVYVPTMFNFEDKDEAKYWDNTAKRMNKEWDAEFYEGWVGVNAGSKYPTQLVGAEKKTPHWTKHRWEEG